MAEPQKNKDISIELPVVDLDRIRATYAELKKMQVELDPNPIEYGPRRFNNRIAYVRAMLDRLDQIFLQVSEDLHIFKRVINAKRTLYEFAKRELMVNDTRVRVGRSQAEREDLADIRLSSELEELADLERAAHDLETLMISIKSKRTDLKDAQGRMRDQMKMIEHDISMGARWGNNPAPSMSRSLQELDNMLASMPAPSIEDEDSTEGSEDIVVENSPEPEEQHHAASSADPFQDEESTDENEDIPELEDSGLGPDAEHAAEDVDSFLDSIDNVINQETSHSEVASNTSVEANIDDLLASLAD